ncbi:MAG: ROK family protein [Clostridia bacterium]|nr:ROK family protein [Clostridia bacterium]
MELVMKFTPKFDKDFQPLSIVLRDYRELAKNMETEKLKVCVERTKGYNYIYELDVIKSDEYKDLSYRLCERMIKTILWVVGGYKIYIQGPKYVYEGIKNAYTPSGARAFDFDFMSGVYESDMEVYYSDENNFPSLSTCSLKIGGHLDGCRIGFDAGGSDRKVSAVIDGEVVYSEEVVWHPKTQTDYNYHYQGIKESILTAASKMPRVDAIGVSSAGVYIDNKIMVSSLFVKVPKEFYHEHVKTMYIDIAKELNIPIEVANDGDVTALAGAIDLNDNGVLGIAMGTSEAGGYINLDGGLNGWISELAFVPVDFSLSAMQDEWSGDIGCGVKYFSQDAVIKLAQNSGFKFEEGLTPAEKLNVIQDLMKNGDEMAKTIYADIGIYLGYAIPFYAEFYDIKHLLLLGRVTSGKGGSIIMENAKKVLEEEFSHLNINIEMPDEKNKRVGQSIAAASLTEIK